jgi:hypothetical protein
VGIGCAQGQLALTLHERCLRENKDEIARYHATYATRMETQHDYRN